MACLCSTAQSSADPAGSLLFPPASLVEKREWNLGRCRGDGHLIAVWMLARILPFLLERWARGIVHLWIKCNKVQKNSTLILFLSLFSLHSILFILLFILFFKYFYSSMPFCISVDTVLCAVCSWAPTQLTLSFSNQDGGLVEEPTTSPFLPSPSLKLPLSNSALPNQTLGGIASGLGMQNLNSSRQVRLPGEMPRWISALWDSLLVAATSPGKTVL